MAQIEFTKANMFALLDRLHLTNEELAQAIEWLKDYTTQKSDILPCAVEYTGYDPDGEQNGMPTVLTQHYSKLAYGDPVFAHLGIKLLFYPVVIKPSITTIASLQKEADKIWHKCHPMTLPDWLKFAVHQKDYFDLNKILKGLARPVDLPDIRDHIYYLHNIHPDCTEVTKIDVATGETSLVPISEADFILCVAE